MTALLLQQDRMEPKPAVVPLTLQTSPPRRTPDNVGFMEASYTVAAVLYASYLVLMFRRWSRLRDQQKRSNARSHSGTQ